MRNSRMAELIGRRIQELVYYTIHFLQITQYQEQTWSADTNIYFFEEDDWSYNLRVSGSLLLKEIISTFHEEGIDPILEGLRKRFSESCSLKKSGFSDWWRLCEASLFALASISEELLEVHYSRSKNINIRNLLDQMITEDMGIGIEEYPFLQARIYSVMSKYSPVISKRIKEQIFNAMIQAISLDVPPPVKVGACQALCLLLPEANKEIVKPLIVGLFTSLSNLLKQASDETLHLMLETLLAVVKAGHELSLSVEPILSPVILDVWLQNITDPIVSMRVVKILQAILNTPGCMKPLISRILQLVKATLTKPQQQPDGLVAGSLELLAIILRRAPANMIRTAFDFFFNYVIQVILESGDLVEMQNATECLVLFVSGGRRGLLVWSGNAEFTIKRLLDAAYRLLDPTLESSASIFVGSYILQLILYLPSEMDPHKHKLVWAIVRHMLSSQIAAVKYQLVVLFARLVYLFFPNVDEFTGLLISVPVDGHVNAFFYVMSEWTKLQGEFLEACQIKSIVAAYQIKVTIIGLTLLLATRYVLLSLINAQGHLLMNTHSKAKFVPEQSCVGSLPAKMFSLICDALVAIQEQGLCVEVFDEFMDEGLQNEPMKLDPIHKINLEEFLYNFFANWSIANKSYFHSLFVNLAQEQKLAVLKVLEAAYD